MRKLKVMTAFMGPGGIKRTEASEDHSEPSSSSKGSPRKLLQKGELAKREREKREKSPSPALHETPFATEWPFVPEDLNGEQHSLVIVPCPFHCLLTWIVSFTT